VNAYVSHEGAIGARGVVCCRRFSAVQSISTANLGPLIAYLVPGATVLAGASEFSPTLRLWFALPPVDAPTIGGFLYLTVAALAAGMTVSAVRWAVVDTLHARTGLKSPPLNFARLANNVEAFELLIQIHYNHYQFYSNMFVATAAAYACFRAKAGGLLPLGWADLGFALLEAVFFVTSRDTLNRYYTRSRQLLGVLGRGRAQDAPGAGAFVKHAP
jgi:hypothetical protein